MVVENYYVAISDQHQIGTTYHTQVACPTFKTSSEIVLAPIAEENGRQYASWRGATRLVEPCTRCPDELEWDWQDQSACKNAWNEGYDLVDPVDPAALISRFCDGCEVRLECGEFALSRVSEMAGVWGGVHLPAMGKVRKERILRLRGECAILRNSKDAA